MTVWLTTAPSTEHKPEFNQPVHHRCHISTPHCTDCTQSLCLITFQSLLWVLDLKKSPHKTSELPQFSVSQSCWLIPSGATQLAARGSRESRHRCHKTIASFEVLALILSSDRKNWITNKTSEAKESWIQLWLHRESFDYILFHLTICKNMIFFNHMRPVKAAFLKLWDRSMENELNLDFKRSKLIILLSVSWCSWIHTPMTKTQSNDNPLFALWVNSQFPLNTGLHVKYFQD